MSSRNNSILIVDDESDIREGVSRWLTTAGYETLMAEDGVQAVAMTMQTLPQAILLDVMMPNKGGMEVLSELRANETTRNLPVVMLSASLRDQQRALDAGAQFFIQKPYDGKKIASIVKAAIDQQQAQQLSHVSKNPDAGETS